jgi:hypothetical protein
MDIESDLFISGKSATTDNATNIYVETSQPQRVQNVFNQTQKSDINPSISINIDEPSTELQLLSILKSKQNYVITTEGNSDDHEYINKYTNKANVNILTLNRDLINMSDLYLDSAKTIPIDYSAYQKIEQLYNKVERSNAYTFVVSADTARYLRGLVNYNGINELKQNVTDTISSLNFNCDDRRYFSPFFRQQHNDRIQTLLINMDAVNVSKCKKVSTVIELFIKRLKYKHNVSYTDASAMVNSAIHLIHLIDSHLGISVDYVNFEIIMHLNWLTFKNDSIEYMKYFRYIIQQEYAKIPVEWLPKIFDGYLLTKENTVYTVCSRDRQLTYPGYPVYMNDVEHKVLVAWNFQGIDNMYCVNHGFLGTKSITTTLYYKRNVSFNYLSRVITISLPLMDLFSDILDNIIYILTAKESVEIVECVSLFTSAHSLISDASPDVFAIYYKLMLALSHPILVNQLLTDVASNDQAFADVLMKIDRQGNFIHRDVIAKKIFNSLSAIRIDSVDKSQFMNNILVCSCTVKCFAQLQSQNRYSCC